MAEPTAVNGQITDAVTQSNVTVLGGASSQALGALYQQTASALALAAQNAVANQQNANTIAAAVITASVNALVGAAPKA